MRCEILLPPAEDSFPSPAEDPNWSYPNRPYVEKRPWVKAKPEPEFKQEKSKMTRQKARTRAQEIVDARQPFMTLKNGVVTQLNPSESGSGYEVTMMQDERCLCPGKLVGDDWAVKRIAKHLEEEA